MIFSFITWPSKPLGDNEPAPEPVTLAYYTSASANGANVTIPAGVAGKVGIFAQVGYTAATPVPSDNWPSGWTRSGASLSNTTTRMNLGFKLLELSDEGASLPYLNGTNVKRATLAVFTPSVALASVGLNGGAGSLGSGAQSGTIANDDAADCFHVALCFSYSALPANYVMAPIYDHTYGYGFLRLMFRNVSTPGADSDYSFDDGGAINGVLGMAIELVT